MKMNLDMLWQKIIIKIIRVFIKKRTPDEKLRFLFELDNRLYALQGETAIKYGNGVHPKHRVMKYHGFFKSHINIGDSVLDVGCGNAELAYDIVETVEGSSVVGIDINENKIAAASRSYVHPQLTLKVGDVLKQESLASADVVILSNVLEHIDDRVTFLSYLKEKVGPDRFLIRVPLFERDWRVPLKKEVNVDYRLDATHCIEYTMDEFKNELELAGLVMFQHSIRWGELWCVVKEV